MELRRRIVKLPLLPQCIPFWCVQAFEIVRPGEAESFRNVGNRMLLWHGSRITNWAGILSQSGKHARKLGSSVTRRSPPNLSQCTRCLADNGLHAGDGACLFHIFNAPAPLHLAGPSHCAAGGPGYRLHVRQGSILCRYGETHAVDVDTCRSHSSNTLIARPTCNPPPPYRCTLT
eukprot:scaffold75502_cov32-Tisochrysis_lutea.AAC.6